MTNQGNKEPQDNNVQSKSMDITMGNNQEPTTQHESGNTTDTSSITSNMSSRKNKHQKSHNDKQETRTSSRKNAKEETRQIIAHYQAKLEKLLATYHEALPTATTENLQAHQNEITKTRKTLVQFKETYEETYGKKGKKSGNTTTNTIITTQNKPTNRMTAKDVPFFQLAGSVTKDKTKPVFESVGHFLVHFRKIVEANTEDKIDNQWHRWLLLAFPYHLDYWYNTKLQGRKYTWKRVKKVVKKRFQAKDRELNKATEVYNMTMQEGENITEYGTRFQNAAQEGGLEDNQGLAMCFLASLHEHIQENVSVVW